MCLKETGGERSLKEEEVAERLVGGKGVAAHRGEDGLALARSAGEAVVKWIDGEERLWVGALAAETERCP